MRVSGTSLTENIKPKVSLVSCTNDIKETLFSLWTGSRHQWKMTTEELRDIINIDIKEVKLTSSPRVERIIKNSKLIVESYPEHKVEVISSSPRVEVVLQARHIIDKVVEMAVKADVPASESVQFTFCIDNCSVALREQLVRSKFASYWTATSRTADLTKMDVMMSDSIDSNNDAKKIYEDTVESIRQAYTKLTELGIPTEDIRLSPESRLHRVYWMISLRAIKPILSKRLDWMAQATLWTPIVEGVIEIFNSLGISNLLNINPPVTITDGKVVYHKYDNENEDRYYGRDPQPVDPLWLLYRGYDKMPDHTNFDHYYKLKELYIKLWSPEVLEVLGWDPLDLTKGL